MIRQHVKRMIQTWTTIAPPPPLRGPFYPTSIVHDLGSSDVTLAVKPGPAGQWLIVMPWAVTPNEILVDLPAGTYDIAVKDINTDQPPYRESGVKVAC